MLNEVLSSIILHIYFIVSASKISLAEIVTWKFSSTKEVRLIASKESPPNSKKFLFISIFFESSFNKFIKND